MELEQLGLTNGEYAEVCNLMLFLKFMKRTGALVPTDAKELDDLLCEWVTFSRRAQMEGLLAEGKITKAGFDNVMRSKRKR